MTAAAMPLAWPALLAVATAASFVAAAAWRALALRRHWLDQPDARRLHTVPTPRGGGIGIALVLLAMAPFLPQGAWFAGGLGLVAGAGLVDDLRPLRALPKFLLQLAGTGLLAWAWPAWPQVLGPVAGAALAWFGALALVNLWNFMDGSNGLAASQGALAAAVLAALAGGGPALALGVALAGACLGFLPLNLPRARLFLGDVGSHAIGYGLAALLLATIAQGVSPWLAVIPLSAFVVDSTLTLLSRLRRRRAVWRAHREHLYQRAIAHGASHVAVCAAYAAWTLAVSALCLYLAPRPAFGAVALVVVSTVAVGLHTGFGRRWPRTPEGMESHA